MDLRANKNFTPLLKDVERAFGRIPRRNIGVRSVMSRHLPTGVFPPETGRGTLPYMNIGIFGGTFDPVHRGHLAVARAAQRACKLGRVYFVPANIPPHKQKAPLTAFAHRYAMLALALRDEPDFVPSLIEAPAEGERRPNYTLDTVRRFRSMVGKRDRLAFIIGIDAFVDLPTWYKPQVLLREVQFVVVSRPGFELTEATLAAVMKKIPGTGGLRIQVVDTVAEDVSSTALRRSLASGRVPRRLLDPAVVEYIGKEHLYGARDKGRGARAEHSIG